MGKWNSDGFLLLIDDDCWCIAINVSLVERRRGRAMHLLLLFHGEFSPNVEQEPQWSD